MAPLKFEENIKESLSKRTITPSQGSWNKLAAKLEGEKSKKTPTIWWAIAAGFIGLILIGSLLFKGEGDNTQQQDMVEGNEATEQLILPVQQTDTDLIEVAIESPERKTSNQSDKNVEVLQKPIDNKPEVAVISSKELPAANQEKINLNSPKQEVEVSKVADSDPKPIKNAFDSKVEQVVNQILNSQAKNGQITEAEVAALLDLAQKDLKTKSQIDPLTQKVDAMALLDEVEFDLERSFRDKVFDALGDGYSKIRTAMAERNN